MHTNITCVPVLFLQSIHTNVAPPLSRHVVIREWAQGDLTGQVIVNLECLEPQWTKGVASTLLTCFAQDVLVNWVQKNVEKQHSKKCTLDTTLTGVQVLGVYFLLLFE